MRLFLLCLVAGVCAVTPLPDPQAVVAIASCLLLTLLAAALVCRCARKRFVLALFALLAGALWHGVWSTERQRAVLPGELEGKTLSIEGIVVSLPESKGGLTGLELIVSSGNELLRGARLQLNYYGEKTFRAGELWQLHVRLKRPRGLANPGSFDYEAWLFQRAINARGYIVDDGYLQRLESGVSPLQALRGSIRRAILAQVGDHVRVGMLLALVLGDTSNLPDHSRQMLQATGTSHLFVVSGLHIGLVGSFVYLIIRAAGLLLAPVYLAMPSNKSAATVAVAAGCIYGFLAGMGLPVQRAIVMSLVLLAGVLLGRPVPAHVRLLVALAVILLMNPLAPTGMGFWFSFLAVTALFLRTGPAREVWDEGHGVWHSSWRKLSEFAAAQLSVVFMLAVPLAIYTGEVSVLAPVANFLSIPVMGFFILPLALMGAGTTVLVPGAGNLPLILALGSLEMLVDFLAWLLRLSEGVNALTIPYNAGLQWPLLAGLSLFVVFGRIWRKPFLALVASVCLLSGLFLPAAEPGGEPELLVLDVGQGLSVLFRAGGKHILYDAGPALAGGFDAGSAVVVPTLRRLGIRYLDILIISHGDSDHAGGAASVLEYAEVGRIVANRPDSSPVTGAEVCHEFGGFGWQDFRIEILHPARLPEPGNPGSCVVRISGPDFEILLPGDIDAATETGLLLRHPAAVKSRLLVSAHHGSASSSSWAFLKHVDADVVIHSSGYRNAFGHPAARVVERIGRLGSEQFNTASSGMIRVDLGRPELPVQEFRTSHPRYWRFGSETGLDSRLDLSKIWWGR